jgi:hypothetical protein
MKKLAIHSVPRSGSTWLGSIFDSHPDVAYKMQPLFSYAFKDYLDNKSSNERIHLFFNEIARSKDAFINQLEAKEKGIIPVFKKSQNYTHCCYKEVRYHHILENMLTVCPDVNAVLIIRNPLAVLYSWYKAPKEFRPEKGWKFDEEWLYAPKKNLNLPEEFHGYAKWKEAANLFLELKQSFPNQVSLVNYKDLLNDTKNEVIRLFDFAGLEVDEQTKQFIKESTTQNNEDAYAVYKTKSKDDKWKDLPEHIIEYIYNDLKGTSLEMYLD